MGAISTVTMDVWANQWAANGSRTIEFFSYGRNTPHYFHGIMVGHTTAETRSNPNVLPLRESPCISPTAPQCITYSPSPRTYLSDTKEVYPVGTSELGIAPMHSEVYSAGGCGLDLAHKLGWG